MRNPYNDIMIFRFKDVTIGIMKKGVKFRTNKRRGGTWFFSGNVKLEGRGGSIGVLYLIFKLVFIVREVYNPSICFFLIYT